MAKSAQREDRRSDGSPEVIRLQEQLKMSQRDIQELRNTVWGNGKDGHNSKISILIQKESVRSAWDNRVYGILMIIVLKIGYDLFKSVF